MLKPNSVLSKSMFAAVLAVLSLTTSPIARAEGHGPGNGGNAVLVDGKLYLLDLVEAGVQSHPYLKGANDSGSEAARFRKRADWRFGFNQFAPSTVQVFKSELAAMPPLVRDQFLAVFDLYQWRILDLPLQEVKGVKSPLDLSKTTVYQVAYRRDSAIMINKKIWDQLDSANQVALMLHEIVYAMLRPQPNGDGTFVQESWDARLIVGDFFSSQAFERNFRSYERNGVPMLSIFPADKRNHDSRIDYTPEIISYGLGGSDGATGNLVRINFGPTVDILGKGARERDYFKVNVSTDLTSEIASARSGNNSTVRYACEDVMRNYGGKMIAQTSVLVASLQLKDYKTSDGYTKYVAVDFAPMRSFGVETRDSKGVDHLYRGRISATFVSKADCEKRIGGVILELAKTLHTQYDYADAK